MAATCLLRSRGISGRTPDEAPSTDPLAAPLARPISGASELLRSPEGSPAAAFITELNRRCGESSCWLRRSLSSSAHARAARAAHSSPEGRLDG